MSGNQPRNYQKNAVNALFGYFLEGNKGHPLVVAPTGSGKTHILAYFCQKVYERYPTQKILILTHVKEIIQQDYDTLCAYLPNELVGIYSTGLNSWKLAHITIASIQSVYKKAGAFKDYSLVIVDEAHLIPPKGEGRYQTFFKMLPKVSIVGLTATPFRRGHGMLTEGHLFDRIVYNIEIQYLINKGYLSPLSTKVTDYVMDTKGIKVIGGDYAKADLSRKLDNTHVTDKVLLELIKFKDKFKSWLIFAIDIAHCEHIAEKLTSLGVLAAPVHSKLDFDRSNLIELFKSKTIKALVAVETLTTGFDVPDIDLIVLLRPTQSPVLHVQMLGRGMRIAPNKERCIVLDFAGNVARLGPVNDVIIKKIDNRKKGKGGAITKVCSNCKEIVSIATKLCPGCGKEFTIKSKLTFKASDKAILKEPKQSRWLKVFTTTYSKHKKSNKKPSFKVNYFTAKGAISEWIAFQHEGYPRKKAIEWWQKHTSNANVPKTVDEALSRQSEIYNPARVKLVKIGQYDTVVDYEFK